MSTIHQSRALRSMLALFVAAAMALALSAWGATASAVAATTPRNWTVLVGSQSADGSITGARFLPGEIWIDQGDAVTWTANSVGAHTVTLAVT